MALVSCSKENCDNLQKRYDLSTIEVTIDSYIGETKTQHTYLNKTLKTSWKARDSVLFLNGYRSFVFVLDGDINNNGHTAKFVYKRHEGDDYPSLSGFSVVYPVVEKNMTEVHSNYYCDYYYRFNEQTGKIEDLANFDILYGRGSVDNTGKVSVSLSPICAILRFPKDLLISNEKNSGKITFTLSGNNVADKVAITDGSIDPFFWEPESEEDEDTYNKISFSANIKDGKLLEDTYVAFIPKDYYYPEDYFSYYSDYYDDWYYPENWREHKFFYFIDSDKGDHFEFLKENITPAKIYSLNLIQSDGITIPDDKFRQYCLDHFDLNKDGKISLVEADMVRRIIIPQNLNVYSVEGIKHFTNLEVLRINTGNAIHNLDLSGLTKLKEVVADGCNFVAYDGAWLENLRYIDVSGCTSLVKISPTAKNFNAKGCTALEIIDDSFSGALSPKTDKVFYIYLEGCVSLKKLTFDNCRPVVVEIGDCVSLEELSVEQCILPQWDISNNTALKTLKFCANNLPLLDISNNIALTSLDCSSSGIQSLDISNNIALKTLNCSNNALTSLDFSKNSFLTSLDCSNNKLTALDVSKQTALITLNCSNNQLTSLDFSGINTILKIDCHNNNLESLKLSNLSSLNSLDCWANKLSSLDVSTNIALSRLICSKNQLSDLDLSNNAELKELAFNSNYISTIHISKNKKLVKCCACPTNATPNNVDIYVHKDSNVIFYTENIYHDQWFFGDKTDNYDGKLTIHKEE
ncbi:MAG: leucine-rich repeat domain-containing protein [Bacteroidales bacterium]|nr:leucine-rich repeat domain-containing protein [Bacteroidales bacterium]